MVAYDTRPRRPVGGRAFLVIALIVAVLLVGLRFLTQSGPLREDYGRGTASGPIAASSGQGPDRVPPASRGGTPTSVVPVGARVPVARRVSALKRENGIQIYLHETAAGGATDHTVAILDYVVGLGANSIGLSFPIYTDGARPTTVMSGAETPSPARVRSFVAQAHARGLRVMLRPIIDEKNIAQTPGEWRGSIRPVDVPRWFDSYARTLDSYFGTGADEFVLAAELTSLGGEARQWARLESDARRQFRGALSYAFNWDTTMASSTDPDLFGLDLYFPVDLGDDATVDQLAEVLRSAIEGQPTAVRRRLVVQEVGIPALSGMYRAPWDWGASGRTIKEEIQGNWFAAACRAVRRTGTQGIYYWMLDSNVDPLLARPDSQPAGSFIGRLGERSIRACYAP